MIVTFVVDSLWQDFIVVASIGLILRLISPRDAKSRYAVWLITLAALAIVPALGVWSHAGSQLATAAQHRAGSGSGTYSFVPIGALTGTASRWLPLQQIATSAPLERTVLALWTFGAAIGLTRLAVSYSRIRRLVTGATYHSSADGVPVLSSPGLAIPIAVGIVSPAILVPASLADTSESHDLRCTIEHELAHVRRCDVLANAASRILEAIFFWNPWVQLAGRRLVAEREAACDDWAASRIGEPREYALGLAAMSRRIAERSVPLLSPGAFGSRNALVARIERLMRDGAAIEPRLNYVALGGIIVLFAALTLVFEALVPAPADAELAPASTYAVVAAACSKPNAEAAVLDAAPPQLPKSQFPKTKVSAEVTVTIAPSGKVAGAKVYRSSGSAAIDDAVIAAAEKSKYSPKIVNCVAVQGGYLFRADFAPQ